MPKPPASLCYYYYFIFFFLLFPASSTNNNYDQKFKEAPQYYNAQDCPNIPTVDGDEFICSDQTLHIAMTLDLTYIRGSMAAVLSVLQHTSCPQNTFFHFVTNSNHHRQLRSILSSTFPYLRFSLYPFTSSSTVTHLISPSIRSALDCPLNYARSYLPNLLPLCVSRVLYLDSDIIVVDDVATLLATPLTHTNSDSEEETSDSAVLAAPEYCNANFTMYFTPAFWSNPSLSLTFAGRRRQPCYFNTGVMVMDLAKWRLGDYTRKIEEWMELQKRMRIYELGSLPPFLLVFAGEIVPVHHRWNQHGLGGDNFKGLCRNLHPGPVSLLHWSGKGKPWVRLDQSRPCPLDALWAPYDLLETPFSLDS